MVHTLKVRPKRQPSGCIETNPRINSIIFAGKLINLKAIARLQDIDHSYLSKIISGDRIAGIVYYQKIGSALGMTVDEVLEGIRERKALIQANRQNDISAYTNRVIKEETEDATTRSMGLPVVPRMPGTRL